MKFVSPPNQRFQFSLRSLFWLTTVLAVLLAIMSALRQTHHFRALGSYHALLALLPIAAVWMAWRSHRGRRFIVASIILYSMSLALPALLMGGDLAFGFVAAALSLGGLTFLLSEMQLGGKSFWLWVACVIGFLANASYLYRLILALPIKIIRPLDRQRRLAGGVALLLSIVVLIPLYLGPGPDNIYIGYGVWVAAMLAMWLRGETTSASPFAGRTEIAGGGRSSVSENRDEGDSRGR